MTSRKRILYLCSYYPNKYIDSGIFIKRHATCSAINNDVIVITAHPVNKLDLNKPFEIDFKEQNGIREFTVYYNISEKLNIYGLISIIRFYRFIRGCLSAYKLAYGNNKPDLAQVNVAMPVGFVAVYLYLICRIPYIILEHSTIYVNNRMKYVFLHKLIYLFSKKCVTVTKYLGDGIVKHNLTKSYDVIGNVIDTNLFKPSLNKSATGSEFIFLHISSWRTDKNVDEIIKSVKIFKNRNNIKIKLIIAGGTSNVNEIARVVKDTGFNENTIDLRPGYINEQQVIELYNTAHAFILNSDFETFSVVTLESLACGVPVIVPRILPLFENVDETRGIFSESTKAEDLAVAMEKMIRSYYSFNSESLHTYTKKKYSVEQINQRLNSIYQTTARK